MGGATEGFSHTGALAYAHEYSMLTGTPMNESFRQVLADAWLTLDRRPPESPRGAEVEL